MEAAPRVQRAPRRDCLERRKDPHARRIEIDREGLMSNEGAMFRSPLARFRCLLLQLLHRPIHCRARVGVSERRLRCLERGKGPLGA